MKTNQSKLDHLLKMWGHRLTYTNLFLSVGLLMLFLAGCTEFGSQGPVVVESRDGDSSVDLSLFSPQPTTVSPSDGENGLIAYLGDDGNLYTINPRGEELTPITDDAILPNAPLQADGTRLTRVYQWPAWAKTEQKLAYYQREFSTGTNERVNKIWVSDGDGGGQTLLSEAPYAPIYYDWSPDSSTLGVLNGSLVQQVLQLQIFPIDGEMQVLDVGSPLFWDWSPHSQQIIMHIGRGNDDEKLSLFTLADNSGAALGTQPIIEEVIDIDHGNFDTPDWSPDGESLLFARRSIDPSDDDTLIVSRDLATREDNVVAKYDGEIQVATSYSPDNTKAAFVPTEPDTPTLPAGRLFVTDLMTKAEVSTNNSDIVSYFWSPDSQKIAYYAFYYAPILSGGEPTGQREENPSGVSLYVFDLATETDTLIMGPIQPTQTFNQVLAFHDQYQHSVTIWSPDSRQLVVSYQDGGGATIAVVNASGEGEPDVIAGGELAFWSRQ